MIVVSYGGGTNSTAMLIGLHERGERPDLILFADTGGEKPHTYDYLVELRIWLDSVGFPQMKIVSAPNETLYWACIKNKSLPSIAYGFKTCSLRFKREPIEKYLRNHGAKEATRLLGIDADEPHRAKEYPFVRYPLIEWGWGRQECIDAIARAGLSQPGKSACFFCPSSKKSEILDLKRNYPDLFALAVKMEETAENSSARGLGRSFSWKEFVYGDPRQGRLFPEIEIPCDCYEG